MAIRKSRLNRIEDLNLLRDINREHAILSTEFGANAPVLAHAIDDAADMTPSEALEFELQMDRMVRGPASLLENTNVPGVQDQINKMRARANSADKALESWEGNQFKFIEDSIRQAEDKLPEGSKEKVRAALMSSETYRNKVAATSAIHKMKTAKLKERLKTDRLVTIVVPERHLNSRSGRTIPDPYIIRMEGIVWKLKTGEQRVPELIATRFQEIMRDEELNKQRKAIMRQNMGYYKAAREMKALGG